MTQSIDGVEDLTRFADESFDTEEVDLFEFTGVDDSPLTRLKSIILSLDWEISDDILEELEEELVNLKKMWEDDKVAQVYLQGMEKIGNYLRIEGAYAHVNAMKLLLTLFYNYEKIISSPNITGDEITTLVKSDIRKFKVLQYQIGKQAGTPSETTPTKKVPVDVPQAPEENELGVLTDLNATILELEWEVTEETLNRFNKQTQVLQEQLADDQSGLVLVNGLQALGAYIREQKVKAHPDSFTLLHSFFDGLKLILSSKHMTEEKRQEILVDRVSRLNVLKEIIAGAAAAKATEVIPDDEVDRILDFESEDEPSVASQTAIELPDDIDEDVEDLFESPVAADDAKDIDLEFDSDILDIEDENATSELEEDLAASLSSNEDQDDLTDDLSAQYVSTAMETSEEQYPTDILDADAIRPVSNVVTDDLLKEELASPGAVSQSSESISDDFSDFDLGDDVLSSEELDDELELLLNEDESDAFDDLEMDLEGGAEDSGVLETSDDLSATDDLLLDEHIELTNESDGSNGNSTAELEGQLDSLFGSDDDDKKEEQEDALGAYSDSIIPALDDADEEAGFQEELVAEGITDDPSADLEGRLDSFFGIADEDPDIEKIAPSQKVSDSGYAATDDSVVAALSDADDDEEGGFQIDEVVAELDDDPSDDLQNKLDSFFGGGDDEQEDTVSNSVTSKPVQDDSDSFLSGVDNKLDTLFQGTAAVAAAGTLAAVTAKLSAKPSSDELQEVSKVIAEEKEKNPDAQKTVILTLIDTATDMLATSGELTENAGSIIKELAEDLEDADNPQAMVAAVKRFTTWQKELFNRALQQGSGTTSQPDVTSGVDEDIASQVKENFSQLREALLNEFAEIKQELKKE